MPPQSSIPNPTEDRLLPPGHPDRPRKQQVGPTFGIIIILLLLILGALYFWGARLNQQQTPPPYIPADNSTTTVY